MATSPELPDTMLNAHLCCVFPTHWRRKHFIALGMHAGTVAISHLIYWWLQGSNSDILEKCVKRKWIPTLLPNKPVRSWHGLSGKGSLNSFASRPIRRVDVPAPPLISTAHIKPFLAFCVFTSRSVTTASNSRNSSTSRAQIFSSYIPVQNSSSNDYAANIVSFMTSRHGPRRKEPFHCCAFSYFYLRICCGRYISTAAVYSHRLAIGL
jgi:hypothetical protein